MNDFGYNYRKKAPIVPANNTLTKICRRCGATFETKSRTKPRCDACQRIVLKERGRLHDSERIR
jgi:DNA-directed RNA polymerase subunit RPC12/RpoP